MDTQERPPPWPEHRLQLSFERGIDPNGTIYALKQAAILCQELAGGKVSMEIRDVYPTPIENPK